MEKFTKDDLAQIEFTLKSSNRKY